MDPFNRSNFQWSWREFCGTPDDNFPLWNPVYRDFELCFQYLCLQLPILSLIAAVSAYYCGIHLTNVRRSKKEVWVLRIRSVVTLVLSFLPVIKTYVEVSLYPGALHPIDYLTSAVQCFTWLVHFTYLVALFNRLGRSLRGPTFIGILWSLNYIMCCISLHTIYVQSFYANSPLDMSNIPFMFSGIQVGLHTVYLLTLFPSEDSNVLQTPSSPSGEHSPLFGVYSRFRDDLDPSFLGVAGEGWNLLSRLTFSWVTPLLNKGQSGQLKTTEDLFELPASMSSSYLYMKLRCGLTEESLYGTNRVTLFKALHASFWKQFYGIGILKLISDVSGFFNPLLLHSLITFIQDKNEPIYLGYLYATGLCIISLISGLCISHFNYMMTKVGLKIRGSLITTIYRKTLAVNSVTLSQFSQGEILNFMSTDVDRVVGSCSSFHSFWSIPFQLAVTLYLLYSQVGVSFLAGVAFSIILIPINKAIASKIGNLSTKMMSAKDERLMLLTELLRGIKAVKFYVWEHIFFRKIEEIRQKELKYLGGRKYLDAMCVYFWATTPVLISILTFSVYVYLGNELTAPVVFTTMVLLNMLIAPLNSFPWVLNGLMEAWVSLQRVQKLIELPEQDLDEYYTSNGSIVKPGFVSINNGFFHWSDGGSIPLNSINLHIKPSQFIGITGPVGSGKSSLLSAILAEIEKTSGVVSVGDFESGFGYVAQCPWLQRGSIKSNILFGEVFDNNIYCNVIEACALLEDLDSIPGGDEANVGEGGSTLSGGQRTRIALARAVYKNHNVYLLDDILSAVDPHVASHIYNKCINGMLKNRTRLLCTHQSKYLVQADWVVVMKNGKIANQGVPSEVLPDYDEIVANNELQNYHVSSPVPSSPVKQPLNKPDQEMYQEEERSSGSLEVGVYATYLKAVGLILTCSILLFVGLMQASKNTVDWWLAYWVSSTNNTNSTFPNNTVTHSVTEFTSNLSEEETTNFYLSVYLSLAGANSFLTLLRAFLFAYGGIVAARTVHKNLVSTVIGAKLAFFDITPLGRILNRFSSDIYTIDDSLPFIVNILLAQFFTLIGTLVMTLYGLPWLFLLLAPLVPIYHMIQNFYRHTSREIKRLTSVSLSPLYNHFTETIQGLVTIRAFKSTSRFKRDNACHLETSQKAQLCASAIAQWLGFRLQMIGVLIVSGVGFLTVVQHHLDKAEPGLIGLALSYALTVTGSLGSVVNAFTETEREMVSVERVKAYLEGPESLLGRAKVQTRVVLDSLPFGWPQFGVVSFHSVSLKYRSGRKLFWRCLVVMLLVAGSGCSADDSQLDRSVGCPPENHVCHCHRIDSTSVMCCHITSQYLFKEGLACAGVSSSNTTSIVVRSSTIEEINISLPPLSEVQVLNLSDNSVHRLSGQFHGDTLHSVNLSSIGLVEIDDRAFSSLKKLRCLDLSNNNLTQLPKIPPRGHDLLLDVFNNSHLLCDSIKELMKSWRSSTNLTGSLTFNRNDTTYCITQRSFHWFNTTDKLSLSQLEIVSKLECPKGDGYTCRCSVSKLDMIAGKAAINSVQVDCSNQRLFELPDKIPPNTYLLNVTNNFIVSLDPLVSNPLYQNVREFLADNNKIESISGLEGTQFIVNFMVLSLRGNRLKNIPTYFLSSTFDRNTYPRLVKLGNNKLECNCTTATTLKTFLRTHEIHIPDYLEVYCEKDNARVISLQLEIMCMSYIPKKWTDYIYYIIAGEVFLLAALISKVSYDYWVFKSTGSLPWPASRMPKLPCDWVFE